jgi:hypothetical protein
MQHYGHGPVAVSHVIRGRCPLSIDWKAVEQRTTLIKGRNIIFFPPLVLSLICPVVEQVDVVEAIQSG